MFDGEILRVERIARSLRLLRWIGGAATLTCLVGALEFWPGSANEQYTFSIVHLHVDLNQYFADLGMKSWNYQNRMFLGMHVELIGAWLGILSMPAAIFALAGLLRLRWRQVLIYGAIWYGLSHFPEFVTNRVGWTVANPKEFGVAEASAYGPRVTTTFSDISRKLGGSGSNGDPLADLHRQWAQEDEARAVRVAKLRQEFESNMSDLAPNQRAAMHYIAAQVAYIEQDPKRTSAQLSAISRHDFQRTYDSDRRIRYMQEWVAHRGAPVANDAYQPTTGWPLGWERLFSKVLTVLGVLCLLTFALLVRLSGQVAARLKRIHAMADQLLDSHEEVGVLATRPGGFGKRKVKPGQRLETKTSALAN